MSQWTETIACTGVNCIAKSDGAETSREPLSCMNPSRFTPIRIQMHLLKIVMVNRQISKEETQ